MANKKGTRNTNGEGYIGTTIQKIKKKFDNTKMCNICKNCKDRSKCNNRLDWTKCDICKNCKDECLNYCDRFYCRKMVQVQITIDGKQTTVATKSTRKESVEEKKKKELDVENGIYVKKTNKTLYQFCKQVEKEKIENGEIQETTINRNKNTFNKLISAPFSSKPIQKIEKDEIRNFLNNYKYLSQSEIDKITHIIKSGYMKAMEENVISYSKNFMINFKTPISSANEKEVVAFELEEFEKLLEYILTTDKLVKNSKCNYDSRTIRNLIIIAFLSLARIGELGALDINHHINFDKKYIVVERTLTDDENGKKHIGKTTKTGKKQKKTNKRIINFNLFSEKLFEMVIKDQVENAKSNILNTNNLLFCDKNGNCIIDTSITNIFKRICRDAKVKLELPTGCFIHMTRHTGISFMISMGYDLYFITIFSGHSSIREIERTYGHILNDYKKKKIEDPNFKYTKDDIISENNLKLAQKLYKKQQKS